MVAYYRDPEEFDRLDAQVEQGECGYFLSLGG